jgi:hypothetical protein
MPAPKRVQWEYTMLSERQGDGPESFLKQLNALGAEGWEAFGAVQELVIDPTEIVQRHLYPHGITVYFKRAIDHRA